MGLIIHNVKHCIVTITLKDCVILAIGMLARTDWLFGG